MKQYKTYLFDLYGTLVDIHTDESKPAFWKQVAAYYTNHGAFYEWKDLRETYRALCAAETSRLQAMTPEAKVEIDLLPVFRALYEEKGLSPDPALLADTARFFRRRSTTHLRAYAGAGELLEALRAAGRTVILLSNAQSCFTRPELDALGLTSRFDHIYISSEVGFQKPDPRFFTAPLRDLSLDPAACLMIGNDPLCDVAGAAAAGMDTVFIHSALSPKESPLSPVGAVIGRPPEGTDPTAAPAICRPTISPVGAVIGRPPEGTDPTAAPAICRPTISPVGAVIGRPPEGTDPTAAPAICRPTISPVGAVIGRPPEGTDPTVAPAICRPTISPVGSVIGRPPEGTDPTAAPAICRPPISPVGAVIGRPQSASASPVAPSPVGAVIGRPQSASASPVLTLPRMDLRRLRAILGCS